MNSKDQWLDAIKEVAFGISCFLAIGLVASALLTGCTIIRTETATVYDFHPTGDALDITLQKPDGTILRATRDQESSADIVDTVANSLRPSILD